MVRFEVLGEPVPQGSMTAFQVKGKARLAYKNPRALSDYRYDVGEAFLRTGWSRAERPAPVLVDATFVLKRPQAHFGTGRNAGILKPNAPKYSTGARPDIDKLSRSLLDALDRAGAFDDDGQVAVLIARKRYAGVGEKPKTLVSLSVLEDRDGSVEGRARLAVDSPSGGA